MVINAMNTLAALVVGARGPEVALPYNPFLLKQARRNEPTRFFVSFVQNRVRYEYELHYLPTRVVFENLSAYPRGKERLWFCRRWDPVTDSYEWTRPAGNLKGGGQLTKMVRDNALMLSVGAQLNNQQLSEVHRWFAGSLKILSLSAESTHQWIRDSPQSY